MNSSAQSTLRDVLNALKLDKEERERERVEREKERAEREKERAEREAERERDAERTEEIRLLRHMLEDFRGGVTRNAVATYLKENPEPSDHCNISIF